MDMKGQKYPWIHQPNEKKPKYPWTTSSSHIPFFLLLLLRRSIQRNLPPPSNTTTTLFFLLSTESIDELESTKFWMKLKMPRNVSDNWIRLWWMLSWKLVFVVVISIQLWTIFMRWKISMLVVLILSPSMLYPLLIAMFHSHFLHVAYGSD